MIRRCWSLQLVVDSLTFLHSISFGLIYFAHLLWCMYTWTIVIPSWRIDTFVITIKSLFIFLNLFYWSIVDLQCCVSFCYTAEWFSYAYIYIYTYIYIFFFIFFSIMVYYRILHTLRHGVCKWVIRKGRKELFSPMDVLKLIIFISFV